MPSPPENPTCRDLLTYGGTLSFVCQGCHNHSDLTGTQACAIFGDDATEADVIRRVKCGGCGKRGRTDPTWLRVFFGWPLECYFTAEEIADFDRAAAWTNGPSS